MRRDPAYFLAAAASGGTPTESETIRRDKTEDVEKR